MQEPVIIFLVNDINENGGYENRPIKFIHNLNQINKDYYKNFKEELDNSENDQIVKFEAMGRYLMMIEMKKDWSVGKMIFMDFKKNDMAAMKFMQDIIDQDEGKHEIAKEFVFTYQAYKTRYDNYYDLVSLKLDISDLN